MTLPADALAPRPAAPRPGVARPAAGRGVTLAGALRTFLGHPTPWILLVAASASLAARVVVGGWGAWDLLLAVALVASQPVSEWLIHVFMLHWRPRQVGRLTIDWRAARDHRRHHADPRDLPLVFIPMSTLVKALLAGALWFALLPVPLALTAMSLVHLTLLLYEWTHFLIHTDYRPRRALYRALWRNHRLHHYRNETQWFGVMSPFGDRLLGTYPDPSDVPVSPTAKALHAEP